MLDSPAGNGRVIEEIEDYGIPDRGDPERRRSQGSRLECRAYAVQRVRALPAPFPPPIWWADEFVAARKNRWVPSRAAR
jgi:hypothetical protein